eukprot:m.7276 g.7276  ORF g.7276 m.7276 type:complete len:142 (-) comp3943_c0_seq1:1617-2042(-)
MKVGKSVLLPETTPAEAYQRWLTVVWRGGGGLGKATILVEGEADGTRCKRRVAGGVTEEIHRVTPTEIEYSVIAGPFPVSKHKGIVTFVEQGADTLVNWECEFTPSILGHIFCCCGLGLHGIVSVSFSKMLSTLANSGKVE